MSGPQRDASSPLPVQDNNATTLSPTFTPPAACGIVVSVQGDAENGLPETCAASIGGNPMNLASRKQATFGGVAELWWQYFASAPGAIHVDVTDSFGAKWKRVSVSVYTDVDPSVIGATNVGSGVPAIDIVTTRDNSAIIGSFFGSGHPGDPTGDANTVIVDSSPSGGFDGGDTAWTAASAANIPTSGTTATIAMTVPSAADAFCAAEILAATAPPPTTQGIWGVSM